MPHKHKRRLDDRHLYNLPPGIVAKPLPARDPTAKSKATGRTKREEKAKQIKKYEAKQKGELEADTPRAFRQLMQFQSKQQQPSSKTDDGEGKKKRKRDTTEGQDASTRKKKSGNTPAAVAASDIATSNNNTNKPEPKPETTMKILPGEKLSDFAARVDREMPLSEMKRSNQAASGDIPKIREQRLTKHDKRLRKLQAQWREEEAKILEKEAVEREEREEEMDDQLQLWKQWETEAGKGKKKSGAPQKKKKNRGKGRPVGNGDDSDDDAGTDPWAKLNDKDRLNKPANPMDVVQAPPQLTKPGEKFKVRGGAKVNVANVPTAMGSLRRREELADERKNIVEEYRRLMAEKRQ